MMTKTCALATVTALMLAVPAAAQPTQSKSYMQFAQRELSTKPYYAPENAVPRSLSFWPHINWEQLAQDCDSGEQTDASTANDTRRRIEAAGYTDVRDLRKGCDNVWRGAATIDGRQVRLLVKPQGQVLLEP